MKTNIDLTIDFKGATLTIPQGAEVIHVPQSGASDYAIKNPVLYGGCLHDSKHYYAYIPAESVSGKPIDARLMRAPLAKKSDKWQETAYHWLVTIGGQHFDYYTGAGLVDSAGKPKKPNYDDVVYSLITDASGVEQSFDEWCSEYGYDSDSRKAFALYEGCQENAKKLRKTGVNIEFERNRLADY